MIVTEILALESTDGQFGRPCTGRKHADCPNKTRFLKVGHTSTGTRKRVPLCYSCANEIATKQAIAMPVTRA